MFDEFPGRDQLTFTLLVVKTKRLRWVEYVLRLALQLCKECEAGTPSNSNPE
jgi:hypothetical protein